MRGLWAREPCQEVYLRRLHRWSKGKIPTPLIDVSNPPPNTNIFPRKEDLDAFAEEFRPGADGFDAVSIDIENAGPHIICVGLTALHLSSGSIGRTVCLRFRRRGGGLWFRSRRELLEAVGWLDVLLSWSDVAKVFHNGVTHDIPILEELGFTVAGRLIDTMVLAHTCYPELPKSLQFCATLYLWSPCWKTLVDEKDEDEGKG